MQDREQIETIDNFIREHCAGKRYTGREARMIVDAEDLSNDTWIKLHRRIRDLRSAQAFRTPIKEMILKTVKSREDALRTIKYLAVDEKKPDRLVDACAGFLGEADVAEFQKRASVLMKALVQKLREREKREDQGL